MPRSQTYRTVLKNWTFTSYDPLRSGFLRKCVTISRKKFEIGQQTGRKEDLAKVADDNRSAKNANGERMFTRTEWLTKLLVLVFFSRDFLPGKG